MIACHTSFTWGTACFAPHSGKPICTTFIYQHGQDADRIFICENADITLTKWRQKNAYQFLEEVLTQNACTFAVWFPQTKYPNANTFKLESLFGIEIKIVESHLSLNMIARSSKTADVLHWSVFLATHNRWISLSELVGTSTCSFGNSQNLTFEAMTFMQMKTRPSGLQIENPANHLAKVNASNFLFGKGLLTLGY